MPLPRSQFARLTAGLIAVGVVAGCTAPPPKPAAVEHATTSATVRAGQDLTFELDTLDVRGQQVPFRDGTQVDLVGDGALLVGASGADGQQLAAVAFSFDGRSAPKVTLDHRSTAFSILATMPQFVTSAPLALAALRYAAGKSEHFDELADAVGDQDAGAARALAVELADDVAVTLSTGLGAPPDRASEADPCAGWVPIVAGVCWDVSGAEEAEDRITAQTRNVGASWTVVMGTADASGPYGAVGPQHRGSASITQWLENAEVWPVEQMQGPMCRALDELGDTVPDCEMAVRAHIEALRESSTNATSALSVVPVKHRDDPLLVVSAGQSEPVGALPPGADPEMAGVVVDVLNAYSMTLEPLVELATGVGPHHGGADRKDGGQRAGQDGGGWDDLVEALAGQRWAALSAAMRGATNDGDLSMAVEQVRAALIDDEALRAVAVYALGERAGAARAAGLDAVLRALTATSDDPVPARGDLVLGTGGTGAGEPTTMSGRYLAQVSSSPRWAVLPNPWRTIHPVDATQLLGAPVPQLCEHPAGTLVEGILPGMARHDGIVSVLQDLAAPATEGNILAAFGGLTGAGPLDAAVAVQCDQGGVTWPQHVLLYGPGPELIGAYDLRAADNSDADGRPYVTGLAIVDQKVQVEFAGLPLPGGAPGVAPVDGSLTLQVVDGAVVASEVAYIDGAATAAAVLSAIKTNATADLEVHVPDAQVRSTLSHLLGRPALQLTECNWSVGDVICEVADPTNPEYLVPTEGWLTLRRVGWGTWHVVKWDWMTYS